MTIPYLPGWWDEISKSATGFASQLPQILQPDAVANKRLQDMIQQNPMLLTQIENMTPEARMAMEQTLGFKNKSPLQNLPVGAQLKQQMEEAKYVEGLTPQQQQIRLSRKVGTLTPEEIARQQTKQQQEDQKFQQDLANGTLQNKVLTGQVKEIERIGAQVDSAIAKYPTLQGIDLKKIVGTAVRGGTPIDPQLMTAIQSDPGAKQLFEIAYSSELAKFKNELDTRLAKTKSAQDETLLIRTLAEIGNQLNDQESRTMMEMQNAIKSFDDTMSNPINRLQPGGGFVTQQQIDARKSALIKPYEDRLKTIRDAATENTARTTSLVNKMGIKTPQAAPPIAPPQQVGPTMDREAQLAQEAIRQRPEMAAQIRAAYKQRTGKDLP